MPEFDTPILDNPIIETLFLGNSITRWLAALVIAAVFLSAVSAWRWVVVRRARPLVLRTHTFFDELTVTLARTTSGPIVVLIALYLGTLALLLPPEIWMPLRSGAVILLLIQIALWGRALIARSVERYEERNRETNAAGVGTARLISVLGRFGLYVLITLLILDNLPGVEITPLLAGLGIGGVAVALATQNILSDLFASLSIAFDKPFVLGDFIAIDDQMGTVEQIGLKTTRVRSLSGEQLVFSNNDLLSSRLRNFARMEYRRIVFGFRVDYETTPEQLRAIPGLVRSLVEAQEDTRFDRAHMARFEDFGVFFEAVYFVLTPNYNRYMDIQQAVNLALAERFAAEGIGFARLTEGGTVERRARSADSTPS
ncbi:MAG TPA: mechanosensitive ion channel family protein [Chloroflexaceae bacterium]|nr:mechanosensitive ion channel family protein [Chloroflexaceae bacterium]